MNTPSRGPAAAPSRKPRPHTGICLYVARGTPNSNRAEANLDLAVRELVDAGAAVLVEVVDVFREPKRAIKDGIIATPTLIGYPASGRQIIMGDLTDAAKLKLLLQAVLGSTP